MFTEWLNRVRDRRILEELRLRCDSLTLELKLREGCEERLAEIEIMLERVLNVARGDGRTAMDYGDQQCLLEADRLLKDGA